MCHVRKPSFFKNDHGRMNLPVLPSRSSELSDPTGQAAGFVLASIYKDTGSSKDKGSGAITTNTVMSPESKFSPFS